MQREETRHQGEEAQGGLEAEGDMEQALNRIDPEQVLETVTDFARENPHTALAVAAGVGFVVGGGLTPKLLGAIGLFVARQYMRDTLNEALQGAVADRFGEGGQFGGGEGGQFGGEGGEESFGRGQA